MDAIAERFTGFEGPHYWVSHDFTLYFPARQPQDLPRPAFFTLLLHNSHVCITFEPLSSLLACLGSWQFGLEKLRTQIVPFTWRRRLLQGTDDEWPAQASLCLILFSFAFQAPNTFVTRKGQSARLITCGASTAFFLHYHAMRPFRRYLLCLWMPFTHGDLEMFWTMHVSHDVCAKHTETRDRYSNPIFPCNTHGQRLDHHHRAGCAELCVCP